MNRVRKMGQTVRMMTNCGEKKKMFGLIGCKTKHF